jgi:hypothetical protein
MRKFTKYPSNYVKASSSNKLTFEDFAYSDGDISDDSVQWEIPDDADIIEQVIDSWNQGNDTITNLLLNYCNMSEDDVAELDDNKFMSCLSVENVDYDPIESSNQGIPAYRATLSFDYYKFKSL